MNKRILTTALTLIFFIPACSTDEPVSTSGFLTPEIQDSVVSIETLSTKPWMVSGGDVLVEVKVIGDSSANALRVELNGTDVTQRFIDVSINRKQALLNGLPEGDSTLTAFLSGTDDSASLRITNYPLSGPLISGPHEEPFYCQSEEFKLVSGEMLGASLDSECNVATRIDYVYWSVENKAFQPVSALSSDNLNDLGTITLASGEELPYIVRVETGSINRAIYEIAMLHDSPQSQIDVWNRSPAWNGKLVYTHGGGCRSGWHQQGNRTGGVMREGLFAQGYAVVSATLNVFGQNCNDLLASETHIMVKERFVENYGVPEYTIATGSSGGSYQSHQTADNYPGVFDGIIVAASFPDVTSATIFTVADSRLLNYYFTEVNPESFSTEQQQAIAGYGSWASISNLARGAARLDPIYGFDTPSEEQGGEVSVAALETQLYDSTTPQGIRATVYDHTVNVYGLVDDSYMAQRPLDNVGVQYGLVALNTGAISPQQFIELNRDIGGFDRDMNHVSERHRADPQARKRALESGRILNGGAGLAYTPIIDYRTYMDHTEGGNIHMLIHQFSTRQRMLNANGYADNHVMQIGGQWGFNEEAPDLGELFMQMDQWLISIKQDRSDVSVAQKVILNKPASLNDACWDNTGEERIKIEEDLTFRGSGRCNELYPAYPTPRHVAGAPLANDIVSCHLRPINSADYAVGFTQVQYAELSEVFPEGVCDWSKGDVSNATHQGTWVSFGPSPINKLYNSAN